MGILSSINDFFFGDDSGTPRGMRRKMAEAQEMRRREAYAERIFGPKDHDQYPGIPARYMDPGLPPMCRPDCRRCAADAKRARIAERHVPDPHYGDWGA